MKIAIAVSTPNLESTIIATRHSKHATRLGQLFRWTQQTGDRGQTYRDGETDINQRGWNQDE
jgi:hypothetical protein